MLKENRTIENYLYVPEDLEKNLRDSFTLEMLSPDVFVICYSVEPIPDYITYDFDFKDLNYTLEWWNNSPRDLKQDAIEELIFEIPELDELTATQAVERMIEKINQGFHYEKATKEVIEDLLEILPDPRVRVNLDDFENHLLSIKDGFLKDTFWSIWNPLNKNKIRKIAELKYKKVMAEN